ncbi:unnamed protein product [Thelazia callipaeda]|uniref:Transposase n=1 Tax=Thelazia callipaeda TaxID=103827 RepID=A0A0N5CPE7_THECL|nr:unnamed protein product [Thelazia callipaeda]
MASKNYMSFFEEKKRARQLAQGFEQIRSARDEIKQKIEEITKWIDIGWKKLHEIEHEVDRDSVYSAQKLEEINSYLNTATGYKRSNIRAKLKRKKPRKEGNQLKRSKNELELQKSEEEMYETIVQEVVPYFSLVALIKTSKIILSPHLGSG